MKKDDFYEEDDGRTIADMSGIERQPTFLPHFHRKRSDFSAPDAPRTNDRPWESAAGELTREERCVLCLDMAQRGIGSNSCGPELPACYEIADHIQWQVMLDPLAE